MTFKTVQKKKTEVDLERKQFWFFRRQYTTHNSKWKIPDIQQSNKKIMSHMDGG